MTYRNKLRIIRALMRNKKNLRRDETGIAAIEFGLLFPVLVIMLIGLIDVSMIIGANRQVTQASSIVSDLIAQNQNVVTKANLDDYFKAAAMVITTGKETAPDSKVTVWAFRKVGGVIKPIWTHSTAAVSPVCAGIPPVSIMDPLMTDANDIIATQTCFTYQSISGFSGKTIKVGDTIFVRPRTSKLLDCPTCTQL